MKATVGKLTQTLVNARSLPVPTSTPSARMTSEKYSKKKRPLHVHRYPVPHNAKIQAVHHDEPTRDATKAGRQGPAGLRRRFWLKSALALVTGAITVITLLWHDWIEAVTRVDPDKGSGVAEWLTDVTLSILPLYWRSARAVNGTGRGLPNHKSGADQAGTSHRSADSSRS
jgi:hypothetical protein